MNTFARIESTCSLLSLIFVINCISKCLINFPLLLGTSVTQGPNSTLSNSFNLTEMKIGMTSAYAVIFIIALFGNSFGLFLVFKRSSSSRVTNLFIANMAVADLLLTLTLMPYQVVFFYRGAVWPGGAMGTVTCKALLYVMPVSIAATVLTMLIISIDRFYVVFYPLRGKLFRKPRFLSAIIWILSLVLMIPYAFYSEVDFDKRHNAYLCLHFSSGADPYVVRIFHICLFVLLYALPLFIMAVLYVLICRKLWLRKIPGNLSSSNRAVMEMSKRKVVRLLAIIVVVFALCWFPTYVNHYLWFVRPTQGQQLPLGVQFVFLWLAHANSAINPCLYILLNDSFRRELISTLACCVRFGCFNCQPACRNMFCLGQFKRKQSARDKKLFMLTERSHRQSLEES
ncbi:gastrin/cholecystokinin type B receptor-like isoform X1 [Orbicella faveolata]|uniref:gastrin/cholecystokinin type B receptor-like isoform X1 n=1 Tax=Orbicella faveolata TaxID=48498 RepID=UPI0009E2476C|nr:gastrin/cholecystokinin type B receptor-like isoform X1 [Orbicella faveolata]